MNRKGGRRIITARLRPVRDGAFHQLLSARRQVVPLRKKRGGSPWCVPLVHVYRHQCLAHIGLQNEKRLHTTHALGVLDDRHRQRVPGPFIELVALREQAGKDLRVVSLANEERDSWPPRVFRVLNLEREQLTRFFRSDQGPPREYTVDQDKTYHDQSAAADLRHAQRWHTVPIVVAATILAWTYTALALAAGCGDSTYHHASR